jgi:hypothetical protein
MFVKVIYKCTNREFVASVAVGKNKTKWVLTRNFVSLELNCM